ncbi:uncharacterized protein ARMOST_07088 [Armillaria ostoyae]|uniref:Uncharacterized protein n=1 Tax=Armillaria ostoyae TaxID=47428 RepID=A0A284R4T8_ARMOS|nr:uncharacterized protein ARMOST_07088 [Armillaria ostoyae]
MTVATTTSKQNRGAAFTVSNIPSFPLPPFICQDSDLAAEVVRLTFEDGTWATFDHPSNPVYALVRRLFHFPPIVNEAFKYAAAERLFDRVVEMLRYHPDDFYDRLYYPLCTVQTFVTGLASSRLDPQVSQRFLRYLHEPDVLFAVCATLVVRGLGGALRDLARLCPDDPAWPVCLRRFRSYAYPAWLSDHHNILGILADLIAVLEGVGRSSSSATDRIAQRDDNSPKDTVPGPPRF